MSRELQQGGNIALPEVSEIVIGIGWEPDKPGGQDADPSAFLLGQDSRVNDDQDFVFYNNPRSLDAAVQLERAGIPDRQQFRIRFTRLPTRLERIAFCLTLSGGSLAKVRKLHIRVLDNRDVEQVVFRPLTHDRVETALILGEIYRRNQQWKFRAVGQGFAGGLGPLARHFGVAVEDDTAEQPASAPPMPPSSASTAGGVLSLAKAPATGALPTGSQTVRSRIADLSYEILYQGAYALARVDLPPGRRLNAQSDAMVAMSPTVAVSGKMEGGLLGGIGRLVSGESLFLQTLTASRGAGSVYFAPASPGDIAAVELDGEGLIIQRDGFLACSEEVQVNTQLQNLAQGLFSGEGFFILKAEGRGLVFLESYGAIHEMTLKSGEQKIVDNGHLVAWSRSMDYRLEAANIGIVAAFTSGENIVCRFTGPGKLFIQTRQPRQLGLWISRLLPGS